MAILKFDGSTYVVDHAVKGADYVHGYDANGDILISIEGIRDFSVVTFDGTYLSPESCIAESCNEILCVNGELVRRDGSKVLPEQIGAFPMIVRVTTQGTHVDDYTTPGIFFFSGNFTPEGAPSGKNGWLVVLPNSATNSDFVKQLWLRAGTPDSNDHMTHVRTRVGEIWSAWSRFATSQDIEPLQESVSALQKKPYGMLSNNNVNFYVDGINGSDDNDGLTPAKAFKTFDRYCEELYRNAERRCVFVGDCAEYEMVTVETFNNVGIHLINESNVSNITIHFKGRFTPAFYNSHLNVGGTADKYFTLDIPNDLYFDGGAHVCAYTRFTNGKLGANGANLQVNFCEFINANLRGTGAKLHVRGCKFTYNGDHLIAADSGSTLYIMSSFVGSGSIFDTDSNNYYGAICGTGARIIFDGTMTRDNLEGRTLYLQGCQLYCSDATYGLWNLDGRFRNSVHMGETYRYLHNV